jgi:hypothetical protein
VIYRWNDPQGNRSPWANGRLQGQYGDGKAFADIYGVNGVNRDCTSVEISGFETTPLDEQSRQAIARLTAYWADQYHVSHETFPLIPDEGNRSFVIWHEEFTLGTGKRCPFDVVKAETDALIARAKAILEEHQTGEGPGGNDDNQREDGSPRVFHAQQGALARSGPGRDSPQVKTYQRGEAIRVSGVVRGQNVDGSDRWLKTTDNPPVFIHSGGVDEPV